MDENIDHVQSYPRPDWMRRAAGEGGEGPGDARARDLAPFLADLAEELAGCTLDHDHRDCLGRLAGPARGVLAAARDHLARPDFGTFAGLAGAVIDFDEAAGRAAREDD